MTGRKALDVYLHGRHVGELRGSGFRLSFQYDREVLAEYGVGSILLSLSMPARRTEIKGPEVYAFFNGLLPEGQVRAHLAREHGLSAPDAMGLLAVLGGDCAGAVQVLPHGTSPERPGPVLPMSREQVVDVVESLPTWDLPDDFLITASLGGVQSKVLLTRQDDGWAWPGRGAVSTHIIKPAPVDSPIPLLLESEDWALRLAGAAGLPAARANLEAFGSRKGLVVERFDRARDGARLHQEDFTQALALGSEAKYEGAAAPPSRLTRVMKAAAPHTRDEDEFRRSLLRAITFNALIGNGDAHSKNYSLTLLDGGEVRLAPLYDVAPTLLLYPPSNNAGHTVGGQVRLIYITLEHLVREGTSWGMDPSDAELTAAGTLKDLAAAAPEVAAHDDLAFLGELIPARAVQLLNGGTAARSIPHDGKRLGS